MLLKVYLDDKVVELSAIQNQQIREIIQQPIPPQLIQNNIGAKSDREWSVVPICVGVRRNNTFIDTRSEIQTIHQSQMHYYLECISHIITLTTLSMIMGIQCICFARADLIIAALWFISQHLLCNKEALKLCLQSFDYWIKVCYSLIWSIDNFVGGGSGFYRNRYFILVLGTSFISVLDASPYQYKTKMLLPTMLAILFSFFSLSAFLSGEQDCHGPNTISIKSMAASSNRILCLFFWKQVFQTWRHKNSGCASTLTKPTKILWIDHDNTSTTPQAQHNEQTTDTVVHLDEKKIAEIQQSDLDLKTLEEGPDDRYDDSLSKKK
eukprot:573908_1